jgi:hypothetical protein
LCDGTNSSNTRKGRKWGKEEEEEALLLLLVSSFFL